MSALLSQTVRKHYRPLSLGGHVDSQETRKLCFCTASLAQTRIQCEASRAKNKAFCSSETQHGCRARKVYYGYLPDNRQRMRGIKVKMVIKVKKHRSRLVLNVTNMRLYKQKNC